MVIYEVRWKAELFSGVVTGRENYLIMNKPNGYSPVWSARDSIILYGYV